MSFLDNIKLLDSLSKDEKSQLELFCQEKHLSPGENLFLEGDEANAMYFLAKGKIEVYKNILGEKEVLGEIKAEEILGEMALFGGQGKRMASAEAVEESHLITILAFSIKDLTLKHPDLMKKIEDIISSRENINRKKKIINY